LPGSADQFIGPSITAAIGAFEAFQATMNTRYDKLLANGARKICLSAKIRMQPGLDQGAGLPVQVLPGRGHAGVPDQRAGQVRRPGGGERVVLIGDGEAGRVSITPQPDGKRQCRSCQTLRLLNTFSGTRHQQRIKIGAGFRSRVHGCPKPSAAPGSC
jgi:hypothetical protein